MATVSLDQQRKRVLIDAFELKSEIVFSYFDTLPQDKREETLLRAISIGVLALMEDRLAAFLANTQSELGVRLESLKHIFDMKQEVFRKSSSKGQLGEELVALALEEFCKEKKWRDTVELTGNSTGKLARNKTGDIVCHVDGDLAKPIVVECKFDKSLRLGDIADRDIFSKGGDTAWSQLLEAQVNREADVALIVLDVSAIDKALADFVDHVRFVPNVGFMVTIDSQSNDIRNLKIAYALARDIVLNAKVVSLDHSVLDIILRRLLRDIDVFISVKSLVEKNIETSREILRQLKKSFLMVEFQQQYLAKFLATGQMSREDLLDYYKAEGVRERYREIEPDIKELGSDGPK